jgi:hypothetical protein
MKTLLLIAGSVFFAAVANAQPIQIGYGPDNGGIIIGPGHGHGHGHGPVYGPQPLTVQCDSIGRTPSYCDIQGVVISSARLVQQTSSAPCIEGRSWGYTNSNIWVTNGCSGIFEVNYDDGGWGQPDYEDLTCASTNYRYNTCFANSYVTQAQLIRQESGAPCQLGVSWGWNQDGIWVDRGCRGTFRLYYQ